MTILDKHFELFITKEEIENRVKKLAEEVYQDYRTKTPTFIVVLKGAFMFASDFLKQYKGNCKINFMRISSYDDMNSSGEVKIHLEAEELENQEIIIIEDIVDTGRSLDFMMEYIKTKKLQSKRIISMFHKPEANHSKWPIDYVGIQIPNKFIVGYGLDYNGFGRNLPEIYQLKTK